MSWGFRTFEVPLLHAPKTRAVWFGCLTFAAGLALTGCAQTVERDQVGGGGCNPNYSGCLDANAADYDCAGGSGNGPQYTGTVTVLGYDEYGLDRDGDGIGCD